MGTFILENYRGCTVSLAVTGLPVVITGEVLSFVNENIIGLKLKDGNIFYINAELIAFVY